MRLPRECIERRDRDLGNFKSMSLRGGRITKDKKKKKRIASELDKKITENLEHGKVLMSYKYNPCLIIKGN